MQKPKLPYVSIIGASHSGSTLLAFLLNAHPQIVSISEMGPSRSVVIESYRCSCGALLLECPFFVELERRVNASGSPFSLMNWQTHFQLSRHRALDIILARPLRSIFLEKVRDILVPLYPGYRQQVSTISQRVVHVAQAVLEISGKEVFVDAKKDPIRIKFLREIQQLDFKVIHLVRDVRGAVASFKKHTNRDTAWSARVWRHANMNAERARRYVSPRQWLRLKYDEVCDDPQGTMDRVVEFIGVEHALIPSDFYKTTHHMIGNQMRLKATTGSVERDTSWQGQLTAEDLKTIARLGGATNRFFGHDWP